MGQASEPGPPVVAVADADVGAGRWLAGHLDHQEYRVAHLTRGGEVLTLAQRERLVAVVVDVRLADMTGEALLVRLRALRPAIVAILTTADHGPELERRARRLGVAHYAHKPVAPDRVSAVLRHAVRSAAHRALAP